MSEVKVTVNHHTWWDGEQRISHNGPCTWENCRRHARSIWGRESMTFTKLVDRSFEREIIEEAARDDLIHILMAAEYEA